jgi:hypothetical protein
MKRFSATILALSLITLFAFSVISCGGSSSGGGDSAAIPLDSVVVKTTNYSSSSTCPNGGVLVESGIDEDGNGVLDPAEVDVSQEVCHGTDGADSLFRISDEPAGANCSTGGKKIEVGTDTNQNGILEPSEVFSAEYVCNGSDGTDGYNTLISITDEAPGSNCATGGKKIEAGRDANSNDILDAAEITSTEYICNGTAGATHLITSLSPTEAYVGDEVSISGFGFGATMGTSVVSIGGAIANSITSWSDSEIVVVVPSGASTGSVEVNVGGVDSNPGYIQIRQNIPINDLSNISFPVEIVVAGDSDGSSIIVWQERQWEIFAQKVDSKGSVLWTRNGVPVMTGAIQLREPVAISDGSGGAIVAWRDSRNGEADIFAQRIDSTGVAQWTSGGVVISSAIFNQEGLSITNSVGGGAIIAWQDNRSGGSWDIFAQRVDNAGAVQWQADGLEISTASGAQQNPEIISDGAGGAIIAWEDARPGSNSDDIYAQKVTSSGVVQWTVDGVMVAAAADYQRDPLLVTDGAGGAIIAWRDRRNGTDDDIYAQRLDSTGTRQWNIASDLVISASSGDQQKHQIIADGLGGAIIVWHDERKGDGYTNIYAQIVNSAGAVLVPNGFAIAEDHNGGVPSLTSDGAGGAIIAWSDRRNERLGNRLDIYAQRIDGSGAAQWLAGGVAISTEIESQTFPKLVSNKAGGAFINWLDGRTGGGIFGQGVNADGSLYP